MSSEKTTGRGSGTKLNRHAASGKRARASKNSERGDASKKLIMDATEALMLDEGYGAVSTRRVAKQAGLKAPLVHYYFPTTDDLFVAVFKRAVSGELEKLDQAGDTEKSLLGIWRSYQNPRVTGLAIEFMALANHREAIREEIAAFTRRARKDRAQAIAGLCGDTLSGIEGLSPAGLAVILVGVARTLVMEERLGISLGHAEASEFVERALQGLQSRSG